MQSEVDKTAQMHLLDTSNEGNQGIVFAYHYQNGDTYRSLDVLGDTNETTLPKFQDYLMNYWRLPFERKFRLFVWWFGNNISKLFTWLAIMLERLLRGVCRVVLPVSMFMTALIVFGEAFERAEKGRSFQKVTLDQWWSQVMNMPIAQIRGVVVASLIVFSILGLLAILIDERFWQEYRQSVNNLYYMPSCITLWEQKAGELIPHNYFRDEFGFERFWNEENLPEQLRDLRFKDRFVDGFDAQTDRIWWTLSSNYTDSIDITMTPREVTTTLGQQQKNRQLETNIAFLEQFQFMSRQLNHLNDYHPSNVLHAKQKRHY